MAKEHAFVTASDSARGLYATAENGNASSTPRSASLALHVLVIGGGWTGLAAAYAIRKAGHTVHVLEAQPGLVTVRTVVRPSEGSSSAYAQRPGLRVRRRVHAAEPVAHLG